MGVGKDAKCPTYSGLLRNSCFFLRELYTIFLNNQSNRVKKYIYVAAAPVADN